MGLVFRLGRRLVIAVANVKFRSVQVLKTRCPERKVLSAERKEYYLSVKLKPFKIRNYYSACHHDLSNSLQERKVVFSLNADEQLDAIIRKYAKGIRY